MKLLYIMGAGRSGSTILGVALENCAGFFYAGELDAWLRNRGTPSYQSQGTTDLWSRVGERLSGYEEIFGDRFLRSVEHSLAWLRPRYVAERKVREAYRAFNKNLLQAIAVETAADTIVDSSHYPLRAQQLRRIDNLDVYLVFLVRDAEAVVESFRQTGVDGSKRLTGGKGLIGANAYLWLTHLASALVYLSHDADKRLILRYEEFVAGPETALTRIFDMTGTRSRFVDGDLRSGRAFAGNRILRADSVRLNRVVATRPRSRLTRLVQSPWTAFARYGSSG